MEEVGLLVVAYNSAACIDALLDSVPAALAGAAASIVVVDNGSTDDTVLRVAGRGDVRLIEGTNVGYAAGINRAIAELPDAAAYVVLNPDLVLGPGCIPPLLDALRADGVGIAAPRVVDEAGALVRSLRRTPTLPRALGFNWTGLPALSEYVSEPAAYESARDADWALGAALAVSRSCADAVGPWDESFFLYSEETDYCLRAAEAGFRTRYVPESVVVHAAGGSGRNDRTHTMQVVNRVRFYARRHSTLEAYAYLAANVASELSWILRGRRQSRASVRGLLFPRTRPSELGCSDSLLPR